MIETEPVKKKAGRPKGFSPKKKVTTQHEAPDYIYKGGFYYVKVSNTILKKVFDEKVFKMRGLL